jgi:mannose-6-phosphate isomerase
MNYGGLNVQTKINDGVLGSCDRYCYETFEATDKCFKLGKEQYSCAYILIPKSDDFEVNINGKKINEEIFLFTQSFVDIELKGCAKILFVSHGITSVGKTIYYLESEIKKVVKPWGEDLWITGDSLKGVCLKKIKINSGFQTSLQYHEIKEETNYLYQGDVFLHYNASEEGIKNLDVLDICKVELNSNSVVHVQNKLIHRLEAITDITLYEVSTPELDDVIRLKDDSNRRDGRISSEHNIKK